MRKNKILHLITGLSIGGAEKVVFDLARKMDRSKFEVYVIAIGKKDEMRAAFQNAGIATTVLYCSKNPISLLIGLVKIRKYIDQHSIELIHAHMFHAMFLAGLIRILKPELKIVFTPHNFNLESKFREYLLAKMCVLRDVDILFSVDMERNYHHSNIQIIPNGIETKAYQLDLLRNKQFTFLAIGRLSLQKNFMSLINFASQLKEHYSFQILIAGTGDQEQDLANAIAEKKMEKKIQLLGHRNDITELCNRAHAFLIPSKWEGFPLVLLEAGAAGLPVITTAVGSIPTLINQENGYLTKLENFPEAMKEVLENYERAEQKGRILQQKIEEEYDLATVVKQHQDLYNSLGLGT